MVKNEDVEDRTDELWKLEKGEAVKTIKSTIRFNYSTTLVFCPSFILHGNRGIGFVFWYQLQPTNT